jgi:hypothetical protein
MANVCALVASDERASFLIYVTFLLF